MRKLVSFLFLFATFSANAQNFTPGNIVVARVGDGNVVLSSGKATPVFLDEYTQTGIFVRTLALPTAASGSNKSLTGNGSSPLEAALAASADGRYLTIAGYDAAPNLAGGTAVGGITSGGAGIDNSSPITINRVVALIDYAGNINTQTALTDAFDKANIRSAVTNNGTDIWVCGAVYSSATASAGVRYTTLNATTSTKISSSFDNERAIQIANNQLFVTGGAGSYKTVNTLGNGLPATASQTATNLSGMPSGSQTSPIAFVFFDMDPSIPGPDLLYVCDNVSPDDGNQGLKKYSFDGTTWTNRGRLSNKCDGVTGYIGCDGKVVLFITADVTTSSYDANNKIYKLIDNSTYNANITGDGAAISSIATMIVDIPGANKAFRGIQMAPGPGLTITSTTSISSGNYNKITIKSGTNVTLAGNIAISDKLVVETGATLDCGNYTISSITNTAGYFELQSGATLKIGSANGITATAASGNIQTCLRRFNSGGFYEYNSTVAQNTGDGLPAIILGNLTLNNSANITLSSSTKISGTINFNAGRLSTSAGSLVTVTSSTQYNKYPTSYSQTAEEASFIDGPAKFESISTTYQIIPIGKGNHFAPIGITPFNNTLKTYNAEYFSTTPTDYLNIIGGLDHISKLEYWDIGCSATNNPDMDAKITLYWSLNSTVGHNGDDANALPDLRIAHYINTGTGTKWQIDGAGSLGFNTTGNISYGKISANDNATHFSPFTLASSTYRNLLPIELLKFTAVASNNEVQLKWQTTNEVDMDYFTIEHSQDGQNFTSVKNKSALNKTVINDYTIIDGNPFQGLSFYRLAMVGKNGKKDYSAVEKVWLGDKGKMSLYPNPVKDFIYVKLPSANGILSLTDPTGKLLRTFKVDNDLMWLDIQNLAAGTYYVLYEDVGGKMNLKFVKLP